MEWSEDGFADDKCASCQTYLNRIHDMETKLLEAKWAINEAQGWNWFEVETIPPEIRDRITKAKK